MSSSSIFTESVLRVGALEVTVRHFPATNYALAHNSIPVIYEIEAVNRSASQRTNVVSVGATLTSTDGKELAESATVTIPSIEPRSRFYSPERALVRPHLAQVVGRTESYPAHFELKLVGDPMVAAETIDPEDLAREAEQIGRPVKLEKVTEIRPRFRILAENEWFNSPAFFESLAAFVQPNAPEVRRVLSTASLLLKERTGDSSLQGYQAGSTRAATIALAVFEALKAEGIRYINPPASFENTGQRIRSTSEVLGTKFGTCIDLAVTFSAVCEAAGLNPVVGLVDGHAVTGIMLVEQNSPTPVVLEEGAIRNLVTSSALLPVDAVFYEPASFDTASRRGREILAGTQIRGLIDIAASRRDGMRPIPTGSASDEIAENPADADAPTADGDWVLPSLGAADDSRSAGPSEPTIHPGACRTGSSHCWI